LLCDTSPVVSNVWVDLEPKRRLEEAMRHDRTYEVRASNSIVHKQHKSVLMRVFKCLQHEGTAQKSDWDPKQRTRSGMRWLCSMHRSSTLPLEDRVVMCIRYKYVHTLLTITSVHTLIFGIFRKLKRWEGGGAKQGGEAMWFRDAVIKVRAETPTACGLQLERYREHLKKHADETAAAGLEPPTEGAAAATEGNAPLAAGVPRQPPTGVEVCVSPPWSHAEPYSREGVEGTICLITSQCLNAHAGFYATGRGGAGFQSSYSGLCAGICQAFFHPVNCCFMISMLQSRHLPLYSLTKLHDSQSCMSP
jgi:hypothetical protein